MPERFERIILGLCVVAAAGHAALYLGLCFERAPYPFELEWMESGSLEHVLRVLRGEPLYVEPSIDFVPFPYPPFYYYVAALVSTAVGPGLLALRLVSIVSSLGTAAMAGLFVARETDRAVYGWIAAGIFLGTWRASGLYFDVGRLDSLFTFLVLAAAYLLRFQRSRAALVSAAALAALACMTKQTAAAVFAPLALWCVWADRRAWAGDWKTFRQWDRVIYFSVPLGLFVLGATALLELFDGYLLRYIIAVQPGHAIKWGMIGWFFWHDLLLTLPVVSILVGTWLGLQAPAGETRSRVEESTGLFYGVALAGVLVACLVPRIKVGGAANNLILAHAWLVVMLGTSVLRVGGWVERSRPEWGRRFPGTLAVVLALQLLVLARAPQGFLPSAEDLRAGRALASRIARIEGEVLMPVQGHIAAEAGKRVYAHQMPVSDFANSGLAEAVSLRESYEQAIREKRFAAVVDSNTAFLRGYLPEGLLETHYRREGWLFSDRMVLRPVVGAQIRAGTLWLPRDGRD